MLFTPQLALRRVRCHHGGGLLILALDTEVLASGPLWVRLLYCSPLVVRLPNSQTWLIQPRPNCFDERSDSCPETSPMPIPGLSRNKVFGQCLCNGLEHGLPLISRSFAQLTHHELDVTEDFIGDLGTSGQRFLQSA